MKKNINTRDRIFRLIIAIALLAFAWWQSSLLAFLLSLFVFYEAGAGWCALYQMIGSSSCPLPQTIHSQPMKEGVFMIDSTRLGFAGGILWGLSVFFFTIISMYTGYAKEWLDLLGTVYLGYEISWIGSVIGLVYGFVDAFIGLLILGWLYNVLGTDNG